MMRQPIVYIWRRAQAVLYVGMGRGLRRPLDPHHQHLMDIEESDVLEAWPIDSMAKALDTEGKLISTLRPLRNRTGGGSIRKCIICHSSSLDVKFDPGSKECVHCVDRKRHIKAREEVLDKREKNLLRREQRLSRCQMRHCNEWISSYCVHHEGQMRDAMGRLSIWRTLQQAPPPQEPQVEA